MQEIDLAPFKRALWSSDCSLGIWLHAANIASQNYIRGRRSIAAVAGEGRDDQGAYGQQRCGNHGERVGSMRCRVKNQACDDEGTSISTASREDVH